MSFTLSGKATRCWTFQVFNPILSKLIQISKHLNIVFVFGGPWSSHGSLISCLPWPCSWLWATRTLQCLFLRVMSHFKLTLSAKWCWLRKEACRIHTLVFVNLQSPYSMADFDIQERKFSIWLKFVCNFRIDSNWLLCHEIKKNVIFNGLGHTQHFVPISHIEICQS